MFKNREFRVRLAKTTPEDTALNSDSRIHIDPEAITKITKDVVTHTAITVTAVYAARVTLLTAREVVVLYATKKLS